MSVPPPYNPPESQTVRPNVPNYLVWSILATIGSLLFCCLSCVSFPGLITGTVAIVFSTKVNSLLDAGDFDGAQRASRNAKIWSWVTTGFIILAIVVFIVMIATGNFAEQMERWDEVMKQAQQQRS